MEIWASKAVMAANSPLKIICLVLSIFFSFCIICFDRYTVTLENNIAIFANLRSCPRPF